MARKPNQNPLHSKFHTTVAASYRFRAEEGEDGTKRPGKGGYRRSRSDYGPSDRELYSMNLSEATQSAHRNPERTARDLAYYKTRSERFAKGQHGPAVAEAEEIRPPVRRQTIDLARRKERDTAWRSQANIYKPRPTTWEPNPRIKSPNDFVKDEMAPSHRQWLESQLQDPSSEFNKGLDLNRKKSGQYTPAQRKRVAAYTMALQQGESHSEAMERVRRRRLRTDVGRPVEKTQTTRAGQASKAMRGSGPAGRQSKFQTVAPRPGELKFGVDAPARPNLDVMKKAFPNLSENQLIQLQQAGTENVSQELLANQKWAHETRRSNLLGQRSGKAKEDPDKVTIFTTNVGHPTVSVPSDSLVGQYIIRKRKSILGGYGVPGSQMRGKFPDAVRDAHIIDVSTGASVGVQGRQGVFNDTGYRVGKKASPGYGRPRPLGSHMLYDTSGRPLYDAQGNIRYSEGATRPIDWTTPNVGFRVLIG